MNSIEISSALSKSLRSIARIPNENRNWFGRLEEDPELSRKSGLCLGARLQGGMNRLKQNLPIRNVREIQN